MIWLADWADHVCILNNKTITIVPNNNTNNNLGHLATCYNTFYQSVLVIIVIYIKNKNGINIIWCNSVQKWFCNSLHHEKESKKIVNK
jgi:hypothetical protein